MRVSDPPMAEARNRHSIHERLESHNDTCLVFTTPMRRRGRFYRTRRTERKGGLLDACIEMCPLYSAHCECFMCRRRHARLEREVQCPIRSSNPT